MIPFILTDRTVSLLVDGRMRTLDSSHVNFHDVISLVKEYNTESLGPERRMALYRAIKDILDIKQFVARVSEGRVQIGDTAVLFDGAPITEHLVDRILAQLKDGFDVLPMARFLEKTKNNPNKSVAADLYAWMENAKLPICDDGDFIAFKKVNYDYKSYHDRSFDHSIGSKPKMDRALCDEDRNNTCSRGLHFCSYEYLPVYFGSKGHVVIVKVNPTNVTSIPQEYKLSKGRCCEYEVIGEVPEDEAKVFFVDKSVLTEFGTYSHYNDCNDCNDCNDDYNDDYNDAYNDDDYNYDDDYNDDDYNDGIDDRVVDQKTQFDHVETTHVEEPVDLTAIRFNRHHAALFVGGETQEVASAFEWYRTPQGFNYWDGVYTGEFDEAAAIKIVTGWLAQYERENTEHVDEDVRGERVDLTNMGFRREHAADFVDGNTTSVFSAFVFQNTPQGHAYWCAVACRTLDEAAAIKIVAGWIKQYDEDNAN